jgi:tRNA U34 5-carboxymethylaminomethyl modifying GTPase MnmE/TrmE
MKSTLKFLAVIMVTVFLLVGCAKMPTEEINAAKASIDAVMADGAQKFAAEDAKKLNDSMQAVQDEIKVQDGKTFKSYDKTKELLAKVTADAAALKAALPAKKEEAKKNAMAAEEAAKAAVAEAKALLTKAPKGKGSKADIEALKADLKGIEDSLAEITTANASEDYLVAVEKSNAIKDKAAAVSEQIKKAMEKVGAKKK